MSTENKVVLRSSAAGPGSTPSSATPTPTSATAHQQLGRSTFLTDERIGRLVASEQQLREENRKLYAVCDQLQAEHEWIVRKLDAECAKVQHVEELYEEVERLHKKIDIIKASTSSSSSTSNANNIKPNRERDTSSGHEREDNQQKSYHDDERDARLEELEREVTTLREQYMPASKEILLVAEHMERANSKLNDYSLQLESRLQFLEQKLQKLENKYEDEPLVQLRKNSAEQLQDLASNGAASASSSSTSSSSGQQPGGGGGHNPTTMIPADSMFNKLVAMLDTKYSRRIAKLEDAVALAAPTAAGGSSSSSSSASATTFAPPSGAPRPATTSSTPAVRPSEQEDDFICTKAALAQFQASVEQKTQLRIKQTEDSFNEKLAELLRRVNHSLLQMINRDEEVAFAKIKELLDCLDVKFFTLCNFNSEDFVGPAASSHLIVGDAATRAGAASGGAQEAAGRSEGEEEKGEEPVDAKNRRGAMSKRNGEQVVLGDQKSAATSTRNRPQELMPPAAVTTTSSIQIRSVSMTSSSSSQKTPAGGGEAEALFPQHAIAPLLEDEELLSTVHVGVQEQEQQLQQDGHLLQEFGGSSAAPPKIKWPLLLVTQHQQLSSQVEGCRSEIEKCVKKIEIAETNISRALMNFNRSLALNNQQLKNSARSYTAAANATSNGNAALTSSSARRSSDGVGGNFYEERGSSSSRQELHVDIEPHQALRMTPTLPPPLPAAAGSANKLSTTSADYINYANLNPSLTMTPPLPPSNLYQAGGGSTRASGGLGGSSSSSARTVGAKNPGLPTRNLYTGEKLQQHHPNYPAQTSQYNQLNNQAGTLVNMNDFSTPTMNQNHVSGRGRY
ncbi:unnamed protein product [Amoebophrya sp. A120]|nr:unnamed protein product [Amoebophrya sp. A120]|eukprot:GSA120T00009947001.1